jgi:hypothetical protein
MPFVTDRTRITWATEYEAASDHKAIALNINGIIAPVTGEPNEEIAKSNAIEQCQKKADAVQSPRKCEIYAVGNTVVYPHGHPPLPPLPWITHDPSTEKPFAVKDMPFVRDPEKPGLRAPMFRAGKASRLRLAREGSSFSIRAEKAPRNRRVEPSKVAAPLPALPACSWLSTTPSLCRYQLP